MKLLDGIHLVMSGSLGCDLTEPLDCNVFLVRAGRDFLMFDAGAGSSAERISKILEADGIDPAGVRTLFLTHGHADHSAGASRLRELLGVEVIAGDATARMVSSGDETAISLTAAKRSGGYPVDFAYAACTVDRVIDHDRRMTFGDVAVTAIATPGHSHDHMAYLVETSEHRILVSGDALFYGGKVGVQNVYDCSVPQICESVRRLHAVDFDMLLPGHGAFSLNNAHRHVTAALEFVNRSACPPSI